MQLKDPGSKKSGYDLDDLVDDMEDTYSKLPDLKYNIPTEELSVSLLSYSTLIGTFNPFLYLFVSHDPIMVCFLI